MSELMIQMRQLSFTSLIFLSGLCAGYTGLQNWRVLYLFLYLSILHFWGNCTISLKILHPPPSEEAVDAEEEANSSDDDKPVEHEASSSDEEVKEGESSDESTDAELEKKNA